jgi:NitT/TauT family transport system ATP-binding protein
MTRTDAASGAASLAPALRPAHAKIDGAAISATNVCVSFRNLQKGQRELAVDSISLDVKRGEFVSLIGPSGCGKTTLINVFAGFVGADSGEVLTDGVPVHGVNSDHVSMMFARDTLLPWRTARENVALALELKHVDQIEQRSRELLAVVGLQDYADFYPSQLSQGMRQRVALARTLAANRGIMLLDEPFAALDAQTKTLVHAEFMRIWEADRKSVVLVTHDLMEAIALSDRVVVMSPRPGRIRAEAVIDLPRPRVIMDLPSDTRFLDIYRRLWDELKTEFASLRGARK